MEGRGGGQGKRDTNTRRAVTSPDPLGYLIRLITSMYCGGGQTTDTQREGEGERDRERV